MGPTLLSPVHPHLPPLGPRCVPGPTSSLSGPQVHKELMDTLLSIQTLTLFVRSRLTNIVHVFTDLHARPHTSYH